MKQRLIENADAQSLAILALCLRITAQGEHNAHFIYSPHTAGISVHIVPADCTYDPGDARHRASPLYTASLGFTDRHYPLDSWEASDLAECQQEVERLKATLEALLAAESDVEAA